MKDSTTATEAQTEVPAKPPKPAKVEQNGVVRPSSGTGTGKVWDIADEISKTTGSPAKRKEVLDATTAQGINVSTAATQYGKWRKFHGLEREVTVKPDAMEAAAPVAEATSDNTEV